MLYRAIGLCFELYVKVKDHNVSETGSVTVLGWMGQIKLTSLAHSKELVSITGQTTVRKKQLRNTRQRVSSVGNRNNNTVNHMIAICAKHAHVKKCKKRMVEFDVTDSVRIESKNLEDASLILQLEGIRLNPRA
jgi:hypothetical protein